MNSQNQILACFKLNTKLTNLDINHDCLSDNILFGDTLKRVTNLKSAEFGELTVIFDGKFYEEDKLTQKIYESSKILSQNTTEHLLGYLLVEYKQECSTFSGAIKKLLQNIPGGYSFIIKYKGDIYAARDIYGIKPLVLGCYGNTTRDIFEYDLESGSPVNSKERNINVIASNTCLFDKIGAKYVRNVLPGEIVMLNEKGVTSIGIEYRPKGDASTLCSVQYLMGFKDSLKLNEQSLGQVRFRLGESLGEHTDSEKCEEATILPSMSSAYLMGFAKSTKMMIKELFYYSNDKNIEMYEENLENKNIILIVNTLSNDDIVDALKLLQTHGVGWIHIRVASPIQQTSCPFGIELGRNQFESIDPNQNSLSIASIKYLDKHQFLEAINNGIGNKEVLNIGHCLDCFGHTHPIKESF